jgi:hypothetical protein
LRVVGAVAVFVEGEAGEGCEEAEYGDLPVGAVWGVLGLRGVGEGAVLLGALLLIFNIRVSSVMLYPFEFTYIYIYNILIESRLCMIH